VTSAGPVSLHQISQYYERLKHKPDLSAALAKHKHDPKLFLRTHATASQPSTGNQSW
jgi:hypothetical protein